MRYHGAFGFSVLIALDLEICIILQLLLVQNAEANLAGHGSITFLSESTDNCVWISECEQVKFIPVQCLLAEIDSYLEGVPS